MVDSRKGITNLHVPNNIIVDASMPNVVRDGGRMWNNDDELQDCIAMVPDRCYARMYSVILEDAKEKGQFDPSTMGNVSNVGLMAQKAEEYGSHDKTFEAPAAGKFRVVDDSGKILLEQNIISQDFSVSPNKLVVLKTDGKISAMVNEEDHLRMACIKTGLCLQEVYQAADDLDNRLEERLHFAASIEWG